MGNLELRKHTWEISGERHSADFFPFIDNIPRFDLANCDHCIYGGSILGGYCDKGREMKDKNDSKLYLFCGPVCGYFELREKD